MRCLLGVRKDKAGKFVMGRESFLRRSTWNGGWPSLKLVTLDTSGRKKPGDDTFTAARGDLVYIRNLDLSRYEISDGSRIVTLTPSSTGLVPSGSVSHVYLRARGTWTARAALPYTPHLRGRTQAFRPASHATRTSTASLVSTSMCRRRPQQSSSSCITKQRGYPGARGQRGGRGREAPHIVHGTGLPTVVRIRERGFHVPRRCGHA